MADYKLKQVPEDFIVNEVIDLELDDNGKVTYFKLKKRGYNTVDAIQLISKHTKVRASKFRFAGNKDKHAITTQYASAYQLPAYKIKDLRLRDIQVEFIGKGTTPINLGTNKGNEFIITIRNIKTKPKPKKFMVNLFGKQRFGSDNVEVGKLLAKRDFKEALEFIKKSPQGRNLKDIANPINALRSMNKKVLRFYLHAYQSHLWNETVLGLLDDNLDVSKKYDLQVPILGFGFESELDEIKEEGIKQQILKITKAILKRENLKVRDFVFREFPELTSEGVLRPVFVEVKNLNIGSLQPDELNMGMKKLRVEFFLPKGCYATEFIRQLFG